MQSGRPLCFYTRMDTCASPPSAGEPTPPERGRARAGRPRTPIGTFGVIATRARLNGNHVARARYRDWDGSNWLVQATGSSRAATERKLKQKLAERSLYQPGFNGMSADNSYPELVAYRRPPLTNHQIHCERDMRALVLPAFKRPHPSGDRGRPLRLPWTARKAQLQPCQACPRRPPPRPRGPSRDPAA